MNFFEVPEALRRAHNELHDTLGQAVTEPGATGKKARALEQALRPHVDKEEDFGLPALGLLPHLVAGNVSPVMRGVIIMTEKLKAQYGELLAEHEALLDLIHQFRQAADGEGRREYVAFADKLVSQLRTEEEVFYPAAILIGEYLKLKLNTVEPVGLR